MTDLASKTDLALLLRSEENDPRVALALRRASDRFVGAVGWPVTQTIDDTLLLSGHGGTRLTLPAMNVTAAAVAIAGRSANLVLNSEDQEDVVLDPRLGMLFRAAGWPLGFANIAITYTHGWPEADIPGDIADAVLEQAVHTAGSLGIFMQENRGSLSGTYSDGALGGVTQRWTEAVEKYKTGGTES